MRLVSLTRRLFDLLFEPPMTDAEQQEWIAQNGLTKQVSIKRIRRMGLLSLSGVLLPALMLGAVALDIILWPHEFTRLTRALLAVGIPAMLFLNRYIRRKVEAFSAEMKEAARELEEKWPS